MSERIFSDTVFLNAVAEHTKVRGARANEIIASVGCSRPLFQTRMTEYIARGLIERTDHGHPAELSLTKRGEALLKKGVK